MKKIGILTFHNAYNFGAVLQAYALKEYLQKNSNCTVEIVNYKNEQIEKEKSRWKSLFNNNVIKELARNLLTTPYYLKLDKVFSKFVNKYLTADNEIKKEDLSSLKYDLLFSSITSVNVVQALAVVLIYLCLQPFSSSEYKIYLLIGVVLNIFSGLLMQFARGLGDMLAYSVSSFLTAASTVVLNVVFVAVLKLGAHGMFIATMCGIAINCIYLFFKLKAWKYYKPKLVDLSLIKEVCGYSLPLVPNQISGWILSASDRTIIAKFLSVAENGVYSVANKFSNLVGTFYGFFNLAWVETVSVHYNDSDRDEFIGDMMETVSNLFVSICVGIIAIMPFVFPVMVNQQYGNAYYQIPILLIAVIFQILVGLYSAIYIALKKSSTIARTTIAGAIINVLVNLALIRFIGLYAASISTLVSYASTALYRRIDIRKYIKIKVNVKNILLNSVAVVFVTLSYYFNITILNVAALVIACIYAVGINWKLIKMFFAEIRKYKKEGN